MKKSRPKKKDRPLTHDQWIEVQVVNGVTVTTFYPPNREFEKERLEMDPAPSLIYRRINFVNGVPAEYRWTRPTPSVEKYGGLFLHRMTVDGWLIVMGQERQAPHQHVIASQTPQPRPEEFGPCPCPDCSRKRDEDDQREIAC
jgi:hypothetical protein